ncbi:hypothetical protein EKJ_00730 [Qipengyuania flava]|uniref:Uncharacterized protein n=1 Tax=Qipengyuania flava TaxID=192812 RepID=A0A3T1CE35_9SPHN|nr:hypothetical protein [Qipengyuania flava]BBI19226.1 hypothetical protein EKJ_00730 [Qipengyuania flava]
MKDVIDRVVDLVNERFERTRKVVLLSYIGQVLSRENFNISQIAGDKGFANFLRDHVSDQIDIVSLPDDPKNLAAIPIGTDLSKEIDPFGSQPRKRANSKEGSDSKSRINRGLWFSFSHELEAGHERFVTLYPEVRYRDFPEGETGEGIPVAREKIIPSGSLEKGERDQEIYKNILEWAGENKVNLSLLSSSGQAAGKRMSLLDHFFETIPEDELMGVELPLIIVKRMKSRML